MPPSETTVHCLDALPFLAGQIAAVGGRVVWHEGPKLVLADAFGRCSATLVHPSEQALPAGQWLVVQGTVRKSDGGEESALDAAQILCTSHGTYRGDGQFARFSSGVGQNLKRRASALRAVRDFFDSRDFCEVTTPARVAAPGTDVYLTPQPTGDRWLITSPEFHLKRLMAGGLPRIYELAHCHRRDEAGVWHQPEFVMLEWYQAFLTFDGLIAQTEALVRWLASRLGQAPRLRVNDGIVYLDRPFEQLTVQQAFSRFASVPDAAGLALADEDTYFQLLVDRVEPALRERPTPVFLTHYPMSQAALAQASKEHAGYAERFELFIGGVELCNGYGELTCGSVQRARFELDVRRRADRGLQPLPVDEGLLAALDEGLPPCSGNALGLDRLVALLLGEPMERVVAFPMEYSR